MTDHDALLRAIVENPAEDTPRLVFADWLDENADAFPTPGDGAGRVVQQGAHRANATFRSTTPAKRPAGMVMAR